jgi:glycosyltransferase involved in cell wall biosynthesis
VDVVSLQHEFGLFGGPDGIYIKVFLKHLEKPVVTTFHTVLQNPSPGQKKAFKETATYSQALVVMNKLAIDMMTDIYDIPRSKIHLIPHGVPETEYKDPSYYKWQLALQDRLLILTFGFLSPNKGIETMLKALPAWWKSIRMCSILSWGLPIPWKRNITAKHTGKAWRNWLKIWILAGTSFSSMLCG